MAENPFVVPVVALMHKPGTSQTLTADIPAPTHYGEAVCVVGQGEPLSLNLLLESVHEGILVTGGVETRGRADCVRCLDPITVPISAHIQELFAYLPDEAYDYVVVQDTIDLDQVVRDQVVVELPFQPVCSPDCPGLDPATGVKRDAGSDTIESAPIDSRWAKLHDVFPDTPPSDGEAEPPHG